MARSLDSGFFHAVESYHNDNEGSAVKNKRTKQEIEREMWEARYNKYKRMVAAYPDCPFQCGLPVMAWEDAKDIWEQTKIRPEICNGEQYMQEDLFAAEIYDDHSLYMLCDGENHNNAMDI